MKYLQIFLVTIFLLLTVSCRNKKEISEVLFNPKDQINKDNIEVSDDAKVELLRADSINALQFSFGGVNKAPYLIIHNKSKSWKLSRFHYLKAEITNYGKEDIMAEIRVDASGWTRQNELVPAGKTKTICVVIPRDSVPEYYLKKIIGMYNLPDGIIKTDPTSLGFNSTDSMRKISFVIICPSLPATIRIANIRGEGNVKFPTEKEIEKGFFPLVDEYDQYTHADWREKIHNLDELKQSVKTEEADLKSHPAPAEWDKYGGWLKGPMLKATGSFRTEKVNGKWWLVDPDGRLFWSNGITCVRMGDYTPITDREFYFTDLPDSNKYKQFYGNMRSAPFGYYKDRRSRSFDVLGWNMQLKYGDNWKETVSGLAPRRLGSWGFNTMGAWSSRDIYMKSTVSYAPILSIKARKIEGSEGHWAKYSDPFDTSFIASLTRNVKSLEKSITDPYCIGYFADNETTWGDTTDVANWTMASSADQPAKIVMLDFLKKKYKNVSALNAKWNTQFASWDDFMNNKKQLNIRNGDTKEFTVLMVNEYFMKVSGALKKLAPNKLYLGCRFDFHWYPSEKNLNAWDFRNNWVVNIAAQYCDVVSFNKYSSTVADLHPGDFDKPVICSEWHHTPINKAAFFSNAEDFNESMQMRTWKFEYYLGSCIDNPFVVGSHFFQYYDQPTLGRGDGENFNCGFISICDVPHADMINASREMAKGLYQRRYSTIQKSK
jgi:hypothetical protein